MSVHYPGIEGFCETLEGYSGLRYTAEKAYLFEARLRGVIPGEARPDYVQLTDLLRRDVVARRRVIEALVTSETYFFRDEPTFQHLPEIARPWRDARADEALVVWSLGCSSGQEAYSILIALAEANWPLERVQPVGIDISNVVLERAREGLYSDFELARGLSSARRARFTEPAGDRFRMVQALRDRPRWLAWNLLDGVAGLPRPHLVFCRNVLIYFSDANKARLVASIADHLLPGGRLILGHGESARAFAASLEALPALGPSVFGKAAG